MYVHIKSFTGPGGKLAMVPYIGAFPSAGTTFFPLLSCRTSETHFFKSSMNRSLTPSKVCLYVTHRWALAGRCRELTAHPSFPGLSLKTYMFNFLHCPTTRPWPSGHPLYTVPEFRRQFDPGCTAWFSRSCR